MLRVAFQILPEGRGRLFSAGCPPLTFYNMERRYVKDYGKYCKVFERKGRTGGVPGVDDY
jgi:hypothetical protein